MKWIWGCVLVLAACGAAERPTVTRETVAVETTTTAIRTTVPLGDPNDMVLSQREFVTIKNYLLFNGYPEVAVSLTPEALTEMGVSVCDSFVTAGYNYEAWLDAATIALANQAVEDPTLVVGLFRDVSRAMCLDDYERTVPDDPLGS